VNGSKYLLVALTRTRERWGRLALLMALALAALGGPAPRAHAQTTFTAVATVGTFADFARQVGGDRVEVVQLVGDGVDPHDFQMTPNDLVTVNRAQVLLYNGYNLEPFLSQVLTGAGRAELMRVQLSEGLAPIMDGPNANPHFWLDPRLAMRYVERTRDAFTAQDPAGADAYQANAACYLDQLAALDAELESQLSVIPAANRKLVTAHDAFPYFARRYGFAVIGAVLSSEAQEPSPNELIALVRQVRQQGVRAIFTEPQFNARLLDQVARETGVRILPTYSDAFPADGSIRSYAEMMRRNVADIVDGLR
jgi:manganese/iron transport system substrate-binding protein